MEERDYNSHRVKSSQHVLAVAWDNPCNWIDTEGAQVGRPDNKTHLGTIYWFGKTRDCTPWAGANGTGLELCKYKLKVIVIPRNLEKEIALTVQGGKTCLKKKTCKAHGNG